MWVFPRPVTASSHDVTALLHAWTAGDIAARDQLMSMVYQGDPGLAA
jgi:hypothetical protein